VDADGERMQRLVTRLPVLARLGVLESPVEARPIRGELEALAERYPSVTVDLSELPKQMTISAEHLRMGVRNLLDNAGDHGTAPITMVGDAWEGGLRVRVRDAGRIEAADMFQLFELFFTTRRGEGGTGLGLAIVRAVAEAHGGTATVTSDEAGTELTMWVETQW
jgi:two-component system sensor histidine kinase CreC